MIDYKNLSLANQVYDAIEQNILNGVYASGEIISESKLSEELGVSRTPVREALKQLETDGLVENILNRGAFVVGMSDQDYEDMFELRKIYEIQAVKWAIERISEEEMEKLEETFEFMEFYTLRNDIDKMLTINTGFHQVIYEASHNRQLKKLLSSYQNFVKYKNAESVYDDDYLQSVLEEHRAIFKAFVDKDVKAGAQAMERHMNKTKERRCGNV